MHCHASAAAAALLVFFFSFAVHGYSDTKPTIIEGSNSPLAPHSHPIAHSPPMKQDYDTYDNYDTDNDGYDTEGDEPIGYQPGGGISGNRNPNQSGYAAPPQSPPSMATGAPNSKPTIYVSALPQPEDVGTNVFYGEAGGRSGERAAGFVIMMFMGGVAVFGMI